MRRRVDPVAPRAAAGSTGSSTHAPAGAAGVVHLKLATLQQPQLQAQPVPQPRPPAAAGTGAQRAVGATLAAQPAAPSPRATPRRAVPEVAVASGSRDPLEMDARRLEEAVNGAADELRDDSEWCTIHLGSMYGGEPVLLPCGHSFCLQCLQGVIASSRSETSVRCPLCRRVHALPGGSHSLVRNVELEDAMAGRRPRRAGQLGPARAKQLANSAEQLTKISPKYLFALAPDSEEYQRTRRAIEEALPSGHRGVRLVVEAIAAVRPPAVLQDKFAAVVRTLGGEQRANVRTLFHGTEGANVVSIIASGFKLPEKRCVRPVGRLRANS